MLIGLGDDPTRYPGVIVEVRAAGEVLFRDHATGIPKAFVFRRGKWRLQDRPYMPIILELESP